MDCGLSVIRIVDDAVVKCGFGVNLLEAINQKRAYEILNAAIIRVPQVFRFFTSGQNGYLIMEYIPGQPMSSLTDHTLYLEQMKMVLHFLQQVKSNTPGPLQDGPAYGQLWLDSELIVPTTITDYVG